MDREDQIADRRLRKVGFLAPLECRLLAQIGPRRGRASDEQVTIGGMIETTEAYGFSFSFPAGDRTIGPCLRDYGEFSRMGATLAAQMSRGRAFVDVGANVGAFALPVSRSAELVLAIEAHSGLAEVLKGNVDANGCHNVRVIHAAAGGTPGKLDFPAPDLSTRMNFGSLGAGKTAGPTQLVDVVCLDDVAPPDTAMVKVDVEGFEMEVLAGAQDVLHQRRPTWLVEHNDPALPQLFQDAGYRTYWFFDAFVTPQAPKKRWLGEFKGDLSVLAVPRESAQPGGMVEARGGAAPPASTAGFEYLRAFGMTPYPA